MLAPLLEHDTSSPIGPVARKLCCGAPTILPARFEHAAAYHGVLDAVAREQRYLGLAEAPSLDSVSAYLKECIAHDYPVFLAADGGRIVGWCSIYQNQQPNFKHLGQLFVGLLQSYRGQGTGTVLLRAALAKAWRNGLVRVELEACARNTAAIHLYRKFGFTREGIKRKAYLAHDVYEDTIVMGLLRENARV